MKLAELLKNKGQNLVTVSGSITVLDAIKVMTDKKVGSLLIKADDDCLQGIITERDILRFCASQAERLEDTQVDQVMTKNILVVTPERSLDDAMSIMTEHRFRHLPIIENGKPVGIISIGDLVKARLKDVSVEVKYLRDYITA